MIDLAAVLRERGLRTAVRRAQGLRLLSDRQLLTTIDRLAPRRGTRRLRLVIGGSPAPTRSVLEDVILDLLIAAGFRHPEVNRPIVLDGRRVLPDFRWPRERIIVEADGAAWHENRLAREADAERQALLERHGERVLRVTWAQATARRSETIARLRAAGAPSVD